QLMQERDAFRPLATTDGNIYVSHITPIDHPQGSNTNYTATLAFVDAASMGIPHWIQIGQEASDGLAQVGPFLYFGGRAYSNDVNSQPLRRITLAAPTTSMINTSLALEVNVLDGRSLATSSDGRVLYLALRDPDGLLALDMTPGLDGFPTERVINHVSTPPGPGEIAIIPRGPGRGDGVAVT